MDRFCTHKEEILGTRKKRTKAPVEGAKWTGAQSTIHIKQT
jgi:hypothetical protein